MIGTLVVAIYASIVATAGVAWQIFQWRHARSHQVSVNVALAAFSLNNGRVEQGLTITAVNAGERPVRVTSAGLNTQDKSGRTFVVVSPPPGADLPCVVQPRDSSMTYLYRAKLESGGFDLFEPVTGWVVLATGDRVTSKPHICLSRD